MVSDVIDRIKSELANTCVAINNWLTVSDALMNYVPSTNGWTVRQNLEHITLTNHYLLILITKATAKAVDKAAKQNYSHLVDGYDVDWERMKAVGEHGSFTWVRPQHMQPTGTVLLNDIADTLAAQAATVNACLSRLSHGEGVLYKTMMSVNGLGKIDVYHYIWFLILHMQRHATQMEKIRLCFDQL